MKDHKQNNVWVGTAELNNHPEFRKLASQEFEEKSTVAEMTADLADSGMSANRRDFLKYLGFGLGAATVAAGCDIPVKKAIPYVVKPDSIVPGIATYYASSFVQGGDYCPILVKTREGRPIKIEGNTSSKMTNGGTSARAQASVLSLYDTNRIQGPGSYADDKMSGMSWDDLDKALKGKLDNARIITNTVMSPMTKKAMQAFAAANSGTQVITYDPISSSAILEANEQSFGDKVIPDYHFDKANVIVSFGADFLGTWISPIEYANQYAKNRKLSSTKNAKMSQHIQVESHMSLTGSNADNRILIKPSEQGAAIATLLGALGGGVSAPSAFKNAKAKAAITKLASKLKANAGSSLVVSGSNNVGEQILVNAINSLLGNYGNTLDFGNASLQRQGTDKGIQRLIAEMESGKVGAVIVMDGANPVFDIPNAGAFAAAMAKVRTKVYCGQTMNETGALCNYIAPTNHFLESWGDVNPKRGYYSLIQPTIAPVFNTRQAEVSLLSWAGAAVAKSETPAYDYLKSTWESGLFANQSAFLSFRSFWDKMLHDGVYQVDIPASAPAFSGNASAAMSKINTPSNGTEVAFFETVNMGAGQYANNPWLQELPDPITRCVWGNYISVPVTWDGGNEITNPMGLNKSEIYGEADKVNLMIGGGSEPNEITCVRQFGLAPDTHSLAIGYGRSVAGPAGIEVGTNVYPMLSQDKNKNTVYYATGASIEKSGVDKELACVQYHHTMGVTDVDPASGEEINVDEKTLMTVGTGFQGGLTKRSILRQANLKDLSTFADDLHHEREHHEHLNKQTLYPYEQFKEDIYDQGHHWGMHVDLNACTGCSACTVACMSENNVPIVGKHEVFRHHEMTWLRIDRYFFGDFENPNVVYQPLMCQHCDNAPCENVCPVSATNHSSEGLNQMAYNRCIGTRYCANNCPFKVRRFNWMDYTAADLFASNEVDLNHHREGGTDNAYYMTDNLTRMVLNPDVTVRSRGVMEKCSFCVQRLQEGKLTAKKEGRKLEDADVRTACQTACPTGAITFGDTNNKGGELDKKLKNPLNYILLEEVDVRSSVTYTAKIVNRDEDLV